jgi:phosphatidylinositol alpha-1,6-mannosyltransferase
MDFNVKTILIFTWFYLPQVGGSELFIKAIVERLCHRFRFVIVTAKSSGTIARREERPEATIHRVGLGRSIDKFLYPLPAIRRALAVQPVDLVHAVMVNAAALSAYFYLRLRDKPSLLTLQSGDSEDYVRRYVGPFFPFYRKLHRPFRRIHAISSFLKDRAVDYGADPSSITVIPNGVDLDRFHLSNQPQSMLQELRRNLGLEGRQVVVSVSRLALKNAVDDLIRAVTSIKDAHPNAVLLLVGDGEDRPRLEALTEQLGARDYVRFVGAVDHREVAKYLLISDVFVRPSVSEGLGTAFLEAMACGLPVIGTRVGGISEFLHEGETGLFCEAGKPHSIASALESVLSHPELAERLGANGRELVERQYNWNRVADGIGNLYDSLLEARTDG